MLLSFFIVLLCVVFALLLLGYAFNIPPLSISGFVILFLLGNVLMFDSIQYESGYSETVLAPCDNNCTEVRSGGSVFLAEVTQTNVIYNYSSFDETLVGSVKIGHIAGLLLCVIGAFGFADVLFNIKGLKK